MDLIEILWKQDIDLGVSRDAYDSRPVVEIEKLKEVEYTKENVSVTFLYILRSSYLRFYDRLICNSHSSYL